MSNLVRTYRYRQKPDRLLFQGLAHFYFTKVSDQSLQAPPALRRPRNNFNLSVQKFHRVNYWQKGSRCIEKAQIANLDWYPCIYTLAPMYSFPIRRRGLTQLSSFLFQSNIKTRAGIATSFVPSISPFRPYTQLEQPEIVRQTFIEASTWQEEEVERIRNAIWDVTNICRSCAPFIHPDIETTLLTKSQSPKTGRWEWSWSKQRSERWRTYTKEAQDWEWRGTDADLCYSVLGRGYCRWRATTKEEGGTPAATTLGGQGPTSAPALGRSPMAGIKRDFESESGSSAPQTATGTPGTPADDGPASKKIKTEDDAVKKEEESDEDEEEFEDVS